MTHKTSASPTIKLYIYFILLTAWLCLPTTGFAEKLQTGTEIGEIETNINGNSRTRSSYINDLITDCFVDENIHSWHQLEAETIKQCILNAKIFATVR